MSFLAAEGAIQKIGTKPPRTFPGVTYLRATLIYVKSETRNITLALPERLLRDIKILAAERHTSVSRLLTETMELLVSRQAGFERAKKRSMRRLRAGHDLGTKGRAGWTRDDLHAR